MIDHVKGSISELELPTRVVNRLEYERIRTIRALLKRTPMELLTWPGFGLSSLREIRIALEKRGLALKNDPGSAAIMEWHHNRERARNKRR